MRNWLLSGVALVLSLTWVQLAQAAENAASFVKDVKPFLENYCEGCHSGRRPKAGYGVDSFAALMKAGKKGTLVVPGKPDESRLIMSMAGKGKPMPPRRSEQPKAEEVAKVREWIKAGAKDDSPADDKKKPRGEP